MRFLLSSFKYTVLAVAVVALLCFVGTCPEAAALLSGPCYLFWMTRAEEDD